MTATIDTPTTNTSPATGEAIELLMLDPQTLELDKNVRDLVDTEGPQYTELVDSIRENGILQAITATRYADGAVKVLAGQRRTLAARELGLSVVPVMVRADNAATDKDRAFNRIVGQIEENVVRHGLTDGQRAAGVAEMLDLKVSQTAIRKALRIKPDELKMVAKVGKSATARTALDAGQLDLEQAAIVGAFEAEGDTDAVTRLLEVGNWNFRLTASRIVRERAEMRARAEASAPYAERGFQILDSEPDIEDDACAYTIAADLRTLEDGEVTAEMIDANPAHWAVWLTFEEDGLTILRETGEEIDASEVDWTTQDDTDAQPAEGKHHINAVEVKDAWWAEYYTADSQAAGVKLSAILEAARTAPSGDTEQDRAIAAARAEVDKNEKLRAERRLTVALNKEGAAALDVRRTWLRELLSRKTPPTSAAVFVADALARDPGLLTQNKAAALAAELLGKSLTESIESASAARAQVITLALVLAAFEMRCPKDAWKQESYYRDGGTRYLHYLKELGHNLTQIEEVVAGDRKPEDVSPAV